MKVILIVLVLLFGYNLYSQHMLSRVSKKVYKCQLKISPREKDLKYSFHKIRLKIDSLNLLDSIKNIDTLYLMESYSLEDGTFFGRIWTKNYAIEYVYYRGEFDFSKNNIYTKYTCKLIENWNISALRNEEKKSAIMTSPHKIFGSRVVINNRKTRTNCIRFNEFYELERDR